MKNSNRFFIALLIILVVASFVLPNIFLPADILGTLPSFREEEWVRPQNSLLGDPVFQFEPWRQYTKSRLQRGEFPLWNEDNSKGAPYFANMQSAILYPLNFFYYLLPVHVSLYLIHFLKLFLLLFFSFLYFQSLRCSKNISLLGGIVVMFSAFSFVWLQWPHTNVFILFPLLLFITEKIKQITTVHRWYVLLAFTYCIAIFGGHPETLFHIALIHLFYLLFRLHRERKKLLASFVAIAGGFFLGAVQVLPFLEYFLNSYSLVHRQEVQESFFLPLQSITLLLVPFSLGAPHMDFYRSITGTNFQEAIGGYVGICVLLIGLIGGVRYFAKNKIIAFWTVTAVALFGIVYKIWPIYLLTKLPILKLSANHRFSGIMAFGIAVIATLVLDNMSKRKIVFSQKAKKRAFLLLVPFCGVTLLAIGLLPLVFSFPSAREFVFISFLQLHLLLLLFSTVLFLFFLWLLFIKKSKITIFVLLIPIFAQTLALFWNYNPITTQREYYPETELITVLRKLPKGSILEVGNPQLPQNLNLAYGLEHIENYDVLEVRAFKDKFNRLFPDRNHWEKVDSVNEKHLRELGIAYVISDYDLRFERQKNQVDYSNRLALSSKNIRIAMNFKPAHSDLKAIRILTANFNRENSCLLTITIIEMRTNKKIEESGLPCTKINDNMFYSVTFKQAELHPGEEYQLIFQSPNASLDNSVALLGNKSREPYLELLYGDKMNTSYTLLWNRNSVYLWNVPGVWDIGFDGKITTRIQRPEEKIFETSSQSDQWIYVKQPYYPGWEARVDGREEKLLNQNPFIALDVPKGNHLASLVYKPKSFFLGIAITFLTTIGLILYFLRQELQQGYWANFFEKWKIWAAYIRSNVPWYQHVLVFGGGVLVSLCVFILIARTIPVHFSMPQTTAINWLTVHKYPKQLDYVYFFIGFPLVTLLSVLFLLLWLRRKKR